MKHYYDVVLNQTTGQAIEGASVTVFLAGTGTKATLYGDNGVNTKANPCATDAHGIFDFYVADGRYDVQISAPGFGTYIYRDIEVADVTEQNAGDAEWNVDILNVTELNATQINGPVGAGTPGVGHFTDLFADTLTVNGFSLTPDGTGFLPNARLGLGAGGGGGAGTNVLYDDHTFKPAPGGATPVPAHTIVSIGPLGGPDALPTPRVLDPSDLPVRTSAIEITIDGGGAVIATGQKNPFYIPKGCTITGWVIAGDRIGSAVVDILRAPYGSLAGAVSIAGTDLPTLAAAQENRDLALANWGSAVLNQGDWIVPNVISANTVQRLTIVLIISIPYA